MFLQPDSFARADFSRLVPVDDKSSTVDNGLVTLSENGSVIGDMLAQGVGRYVFINKTFKPRDSFSVYGSDGLYSFFVRGRIPSKIKITAVDTQTQIVPGIGPAYLMDVAFADSAVDDNYYKLFVWRYYYEYKLDGSNQRIDSAFKIRKIAIDGSELPFIMNNFNNYSSSELLFSDASFNGTKPIFRIHTPEKVVETLSSRTVKLEVVLENLDKPLYDFYNTRNAHIWQQQSISQLPGVVIGNIPNGFGVAGSFTQNRYTITFP